MFGPGASVERCESLTLFRAISKMTSVGRILRLAWWLQHTMLLAGGEHGGDGQFSRSRAIASHRSRVLLDVAQDHWLVDEESRSGTSRGAASRHEDTSCGRARALGIRLRWGILTPGYNGRMRRHFEGSTAKTTGWFIQAHGLAFAHRAFHQG